MSKISDPYVFEERGGVVRLSLSPEFAESLEGDWVGLELPPPGANIRAGETFGFVTTDRETHDLKAPRGFRVVEVNAAVVQNAPLARLSPLGVGWLLEVGFLDASETV